MRPVKLQELIASIVLDVYFRIFIQLLCINSYISMSSNLAADLGLGGNLNTVVGLVWKNSNNSS